VPRPSEPPTNRAPRHRRGVTRAALVGAVVVLLTATGLQVAGAARFAEAALGGSRSSWAPALLVLLGGGLSAALLLVAIQALATDLRTRPRPSRQDASRGQPDSPAPLDPADPADTLDAVIARSRGIPAQRTAEHDRAGTPESRRGDQDDRQVGEPRDTRSDARKDRPRLRGRGGIHRAGPG
jgi:hypothetical protein